MTQKKKYIKARIIDRDEDKFGKVIDVYKLEDTRFFANRYGTKYGDRAYFADQLSFTPYDAVPVMYSELENTKGPWTLGYMHPDDLVKAIGNLGFINQNSEDEIPVFDTILGNKIYPKMVVEFRHFKVPAFMPFWAWTAYCETRKPKMGK